MRTEIFRTDPLILQDLSLYLLFFSGVAMIFQHGGQSTEGREGREIVKIRVSKLHFFAH